MREHLRVVLPEEMSEREIVHCTVTISILSNVTFVTF